MAVRVLRMFLYACVICETKSCHYAPVRIESFIDDSSIKNESIIASSQMNECYIICVYCVCVFIVCVCLHHPGQRPMYFIKATE